MTFYDRYAALCAEHGIKPCSAAAAEALNVNKTTLSLWHKNGTTPGGEIVARLADTYQVSADYLLGRTDDSTDYSQGISTAKATRSEIDVAYNALDELDRAKVDGFIRGLLSGDKYRDGDDAV